uniref:hypothetical protein n=1 Tax=uncultured Shewanella sp. TaxID=173975 RepID=UPI0026391B69
SFSDTAVTPFYLLLDYAYSMLIHSFVCTHAQGVNNYFKTTKSIAVANKGLQEHIKIGDSGNQSEVDAEKVIKLMILYIEKYNECFTDQKDKQQGINGLQDKAIKNTIEQIVNNSTSLLLPLVSLSVATLISLFERLVLLDLGKRTVQQMIDKHGVSIFNREQFIEKLQALYQDEAAIGTLLDGIIYDILPAIASHANVKGDTYWTSALKDIYNDIRLNVAVLSNQLRTHGKMATTYLARAKAYLLDVDEVNKKELVHLQLLSNIHDYLCTNQQKQNTLDRPYVSSQKEKYQAYVKLSIKSQEDVNQSIADKEAEFIKTLQVHINQHDYGRKTSLFFYAMLRHGLWTLCQPEAEPDNNFYTTIFNVNTLLLNLSGTNCTKSNYPGVRGIWARDLNQPLLKGSTTSFKDWLLIYAYQNRGTLSEFNKCVIWLNFMDADVNPLIKYGNKVVQKTKFFLDTCKGFQPETRSCLVAIIVLSLLSDPDTANMIGSLLSINEEQDKKEEYAIKIIDNILLSLSSNQHNMTGIALYIVYSLFECLRKITRSTKTHTEYVDTKIKNLKTRVYGTNYPKLSIRNQRIIDVLTPDLEHTNTDDINDLLRLNHSVILLAQTFQADLHEAWDELQKTFIKDDIRQSITDNMKAQAVNAVVAMKERVTTGPMRLKGNVAAMLLGSKVVTQSEMVVAFKGVIGLSSGTYQAMFGVFEHKKQLNKQELQNAQNLATSNFGWSNDKFNRETYVPVARVNDSIMDAGKSIFLDVHTKDVMETYLEQNVNRGSKGTADSDESFFEQLFGAGKQQSKARSALCKNTSFRSRRSSYPRVMGIMSYPALYGLIKATGDGLLAHLATTDVSLPKMSTQIKEMLANDNYYSVALILYMISHSYMVTKVMGLDDDLLSRSTNWNDILPKKSTVIKDDDYTEAIKIDNVFDSAFSSLYRICNNTPINDMNVLHMAQEKNKEPYLTHQRIMLAALTQNGASYYEVNQAVNTLYNYSKEASWVGSVTIRYVKAVKEHCENAKNAMVYQKADWDLHRRAPGPLIQLFLDAPTYSTQSRRQNDHGFLSIRDILSDNARHLRLNGQYDLYLYYFYLKRFYKIIDEWQKENKK